MTGSGSDDLDSGSRSEDGTRDDTFVDDALEHRRVVRDGYDAVATDYTDERVGGGAEDVAFLEDLLERVGGVGRGERPTDDHDPLVLDAGCGGGVPVTATLESSGVSVVGLDVSSRQLELARENVPSASLVRGDLTSPSRTAPSTRSRPSTP